MSKGHKTSISNVLPLALKLTQECDKRGFKVQVCGSVRRQCALVGDLDFIAYDRSYPSGGITPLQQVLSVDRGGSKTIIGDYCAHKVNFFWIPPWSWGAGLLFATGNAEFNQRCRATAKRKGFKLNRYGVYDLDGKFLTPDKSEVDILDFLGMPYVRPTMRDGDQKRNDDPADIVVREFDSSSGSKVYQTSFNKRSQEGGCDCPGFRFRGRCKHVDELRRSV